MRYFAASGSTVGCQWNFVRSVAPAREFAERAKALGPYAYLESRASPEVTRRYLPSSLMDVQSMMSTMPFVKSPPSEP